MNRNRSIILAIVTFVLTSIAWLAIVGARYEPNTAIPAGFGGRHVQVGGVTLRVLQRGSGRDILLIHGSPGCIEDWSSVIDELARSFRVTAFDRPGHGYSGDTGLYSFEYNAATAQRLIDALRLQRVIVVGHSFGGATALALALRAPPAVDGYVILDSAAYTPPRKPGALFALLSPPWIGMGIATTLGARLAPERIRSGTLEQFRAPPAGFIALRTRVFSTPKVVHALAMEWRGAGAGLAAQSPHYREIRRPLYILAQADDPFRRATAEQLHRDVAGSSLRLLSGTGHYLQFEKTRDVLDVIRAAAEGQVP